MIDHIFLPVTDIAKARAFYSAALRDLGWRETGTYRADSGPAGIPDLYGFGHSDGASIWLHQAEGDVAGVHIGFVAPSREVVRTSYDAALRAGARDNGKPAVRAYFTPSYYAANVFDLDGNSVEFVTKK